MRSVSGWRNRIGNNWKTSVRFRVILASWIIVFSSTSFFWSGDSIADQPNILFIYLDDFGWKDAGYMGSDFYETPHLDRLSSEGMVFTDAYAGASNCAPSRACLMSGQYSSRHKIYNVGTKPRGKSKFRRLVHVPGVDVLDPKIETWARRLQKAGYVTATMGKWHLSDDPVPYGFDVNIGGSHSGGPPHGYYPPHPQVPGLETADEHEYLTDRLSREAARFIRKNKTRPWAVYLTHFAVHTPLNAKRELLQKYSTKSPGKLHRHVNMATMIQAVDDGVGLILRTLEELELADRTIILFYSDNGGYGPATDMAPLKGYKGSFYEGGIRVPFFVKWPGVVEGGTISAEPITAVDLYPTLCQMANAGLPTGQAVDGQSLVPILNGNRKTLGGAEGPRPIFWHFPAYLQSYPKINQEQHDPLFRSRPCGVIRKGEWKLIQYFESGDIELFNLKDDIGEARDLSQREPVRAGKMLSQLERWQRETDADIPVRLNPEFDPQAESSAIEQLTRKQDRLF